MKITVEVDCGPETCADRPGKFCQFVQSTHYGQNWRCRLFDKRLNELGGWLVRLGECKAATCEYEEGQ